MTSTGAIFGRFNIVHLGHVQMIEQALRENDFVYIGISSSSRGQRGVEVLRTLFSNYSDRLNIEYYSNPFEMMNVLDFEERVTFYAGSDRAAMLARLSNYHDIEHRVVERTANAPSSTLCRRVLNENCTTEALINNRLVLNTAHALLVIAQFTLEQRNV